MVLARNAASSNATTAAAATLDNRVDPNDALLLHLFPTAAAALCTLPESARGRALAALREAIAARPKAPHETAPTPADHDLAEAAIEANSAPRDREDGPQLPTLTAASAEDVCEFIRQWGRTDAATAPPPSSPDQRGWPSAQSKDGVLRLPPKPRRPQPLDVMPDAQPGVETIADYRADASNPVVSPWSLPLFEWSPRRRCCFTVVSFGVVDGTLRLVCSPLCVGPGSAAVCGPPIAVRCLFDATLHRGRCGAVPEALVGRHVTVWDPYVWIAADGLHEVQVDSAKDVAFHLTEAEVAHYSAMEEQDGGYALRWFRKGKADGDALVKQNDYAAALRAYVHGLCKCYTRGPLNQPSSCIDELFTVSTVLAATFQEFGQLVTPEALHAMGAHDRADDPAFLHAVWCLCAGGQLFFTPEIGLSVFDRIWPGFDVPRNVPVGPVVAWSLFSEGQGPRPWAEIPTRSHLVGLQSFPRDMALLSGIVQSFPLVAKYLGNISFACRKLQLWSPCYTAGVLAAFMSSESGYVNKYRSFAAIAAANMSINLTSRVSEEYAGRCKRVIDLVCDPKLFPEPDEFTDAPARHVWGAHVKVTNPAKGRGMFTDCAISDPKHSFSTSVPFAVSTGADLASIHYRDWTVPRDFAGLFRVLQQQCAAPCADLFMQQLHFLDGRNDGEFRQTLPWSDEPVSTTKRTPFLFHDMCLPVRGHVPESAHVGQRALFDASRAVEIVGVNATHIMGRGAAGDVAMLHLGLSMCNHSSVPNADMAVMGPRSRPMVLLRPLRPLSEGEEITIDYVPTISVGGVFRNRWGAALDPPRELNALGAVLERTIDSGTATNETVQAVIIDFSKKRLGWSAAKCRAAHQTPFVNFMFDFFKDFDFPLGGILRDLAAKGDPVVKAAVRQDPRLVWLAKTSEIDVSHF